jgi:hypothetical protein
MTIETSAVDVAGLVRDGLLDLDTMRWGATWETLTKIDSYTTFDETEPVLVAVILQQATRYGITVYRWQNTLSGEAGDPRLDRQHAIDGGEDYCYLMDED